MVTVADVIEAEEEEEYDGENASTPGIMMESFHEEEDDDDDDDDDEMEGILVAATTTATASAMNVIFHLRPSWSSSTRASPEELESTHCCRLFLFLFLLNITMMTWKGSEQKNPLVNNRKFLDASEAKKSTKETMPELNTCLIKNKKGQQMQQSGPFSSLPLV